jgi:hypothetical protein
MLKFLTDLVELSARLGCSHHSLGDGAKDLQVLTERLRETGAGSDSLTKVLNGFLEPLVWGGRSAKIKGLKQRNSRGEESRKMTKEIRERLGRNRASEG